MPTVTARTLVFAHAIVLWAALAVAGPWDAPAGYYSSATGTGATLKSNLHDIIDGHTVYSYDSLRSILQVTDADPNNPGRMLLVYDRTSLNVAAINPNGSIPGWDSGNSWNREHTWPQSRGVGSSGPDTSDMHHLRPSDNSINSQRSNANFGGNYGNPYGYQGDYWYPGDADAGMIARAEFYMAVRYDGSDSSTTDLELSNGNPSTSSGSLGNLASLLDWHYRAAPDDFERRRNDIIFDSYQHNRNPFIDHPEYVWSLFVDQSNDTRLSIAGTTALSSGVSTQSLDLGRVYVGGSAPSQVAIGLNKAGLDGTYYQVTATGTAFTDAGEYARPVAMNVATGVVDTFNAGLNVSTSTAGDFTGTVVIDNLDITSGGGGGRGANDGNDVVDLSFSVLSHPVASFASNEIVTDITIDFGQVDVGSSAFELEGSTIVQEVFAITNFDGLGGPTNASDLDLDSVSAVAGDLGVFSFLSMLPTGIEQGMIGLMNVFLDTSNAGLFEATYLLDLSGEDLPGDQQQTLSLTLIGEVLAAGLAGDYNDDGRVDAADYTVYRDSFGSTENLAADGDNSNEIDAGDYDVWAANYGATTPPSLSVPEPMGVLMVLAMLAGSALRSSRVA
ncbi:Extracellular ribonuclease precursor [Botrimarina colliarenosi]|uniref:Extracellular ribonuclease n=1 Tax=Botrimarina colliarenosi TaxID=2528001 RepID=A0A5C6AK87_9BACT|nr:endonuclease [Botrimarina colliarenosi]TWT99846.1 Extracellular ribonuclease precursor [Botrimarina colliarenosi]